MPEPMRSRLRPIHMLRALKVLLVAPFLVALFLVTGCGSADQSKADTSSGAQQTAPVSPVPTGTPSVPSDEPPVTDSFKIEVPGQSDPLVVTRQVAPRGGFQLRVFGVRAGAYAELKIEGRPLVPFVATDAQSQPLSVDCRDGGVVISEAVAHDPAGVAAAWDIKQTSYAVTGTKITAGPTVEVADNVLSTQLEAKYPELVKHTMFASCRSAG